MITQEIIAKPDYAMAWIKIPNGTTIKVESSAMATMSPNLIMTTRMRGGLGRILTGESLFVNEFRAESGDGHIAVAPGCPGDVEHVTLNGPAIYLQSAAWLASSESVKLETKFQGLTKGFFGGKGLFLVKCSGVGDLWFSSFGALIPVDVDGEYIVDTGFMVAFTEGLDWSVGRVGGYKSLFFSGEGFVCRFRGKGRVWMQSRSAASFAGWVDQFRPVKTRSSN
jgi:uncharacterized protein (TIGR00266 family)